MVMIRNIQKNIINMIVFSVILCYFTEANKTAYGQIQGEENRMPQLRV